MDERIKYTLEIVSEITGVPVHHIIGKVKRREYANARTMLSKALKECFNIGVSEQEANGLCNHSTVTHRMKKWDEFYSTEADFRHDYNTIKAAINVNNPNIINITALLQEEAVLVARLKLVRSKIEKATVVTQRDEFHVDA